MIKRIISLFLLIIIFSFILGITQIQTQKFNTEDICNEECYSNYLDCYYSYEPQILVETCEIDQFELAEKEYLEHVNKLDEATDLLVWFNTYKNIISHYNNYLDTPETVYDYFTEEEVYLIARCVETETHGADFESKTHVASVIFNRLNSDKWGNTVSEVIKPGQFSFSRKNIHEETWLAIEFAFEIKDTTDGCMYFHSNKKTNTFSKAEYQFTDAVGHHFYK